MDHTELIVKLRQAMFNRAFDALDVAGHQLYDLGVTPQESLAIFTAVIHDQIVERDKDKQPREANNEAERIWQSALDRMAKSGRADA